MAATKRKKVLVVTPIGAAVWPHLHSPDTKFDKDGVYRVQVAYADESPEATKLVGQITAWVEKAITEQRELDMAEATTPAARKRVTESSTSAPTFHSRWN